MNDTDRLQLLEAVAEEAWQWFNDGDRYYFGPTPEDRARHVRRDQVLDNLRRVLDSKVVQ